MERKKFEYLENKKSFLTVFLKNKKIGRKVVQEQQLQLKRKYLLGCNMKIVNGHLLNWPSGGVGGGRTSTRGFFLVEGDKQIFDKERHSPHAPCKATLLPGFWKITLFDYNTICCHLNSKATTFFIVHGSSNSLVMGEDVGLPSFPSRENCSVITAYIVI